MAQYERKIPKVTGLASSKGVKTSARSAVSQKGAVSAASKVLRSKVSRTGTSGRSKANLPPEIIEIQPAGRGAGKDKFVLQLDPGSGQYELLEPTTIQQRIQSGVVGGKSFGPGPHAKKPRPLPIKVHLYADGDDAVTALELFKALTDFLDDAGYGRTKIMSVGRGSVVADIKAWWNGEDSQGAKNKMSELGSYGEQWALDATANKARAEVAAINANTTATLLASVEKYDNIALHVDDFLIVKYQQPDGKPYAMVRKLTIREMRVLERNSAILNDPKTALTNLNLLMYAAENDLSIED